MSGGREHVSQARPGGAGLAALAAGAIALICAGAGAAAAVTGNRPGPQPDNEIIAYERHAAAPWSPSEIWAMTGTGRERLEISHTPAGASDTWPSMSLSHATVVWQRTQAGVSEIYEGDIFADPATQLTAFPQGASDPAISNNLDVVATVGTGAACDLWVIPYSGHVRRLTDHGGRPGCDTEAVWSPNGRRVAFRRTATDAANRPLATTWLVVPGTGGTPRPLQLAVSDVASVAWGPGSGLLARTSGSVPTVTAPDAGGGHPRVLVRGSGLTDTATWAPDAARAAFVERQIDGSTDILSVAGAGGSPTNVTRTPGISEGHPTWGYPSNQGSEPGPGLHARSVPARRRRR